MGQVDNNPKETLKDTSSSSHIKKIKAKSDSCGKGKEKKFECDHCDIRFCRKTDLKTHIRTHTGEKPFGCKICHKSFRRTSDLRAHERRHSANDKLCSKCPLKFLKNSHLLAHRCSQRQAVDKADAHLKRVDEQSNNTGSLYFRAGPSTPYITIPQPNGIYTPYSMPVSASTPVLLVAPGTSTSMQQLMYPPWMATFPPFMTR